jgi:hypothetical protein
MPVPRPKRTNLHTTSTELAEAGNWLMKNRDTAHVVAPEQAGTLVPIRSERVPLKGATAMTANGKDVMMRPKLFGG